jgi:site-specific recombinase XerD
MPRVGRNRTKNKRLPVGWKLVRGVFHFVPTNAGDLAIVQRLNPGKKSMRLGASHNEAAEAYAKLIVAAREKRDCAEEGTVGELVQRAREEILPTIRHALTRKERERHLDALEQLAKGMRYAGTVYDADRAPPGTVLRAFHIQRHLHACAHPAEGVKPRPIAANREVATWRMVFQWARAPWGLTEYNPCDGLKMNEEAPRTALPSDDRLRRVYRRVDPPIRFLIAMIRRYGRRRVELLRLQLSSVRDDGLHLVRGKRPKPIIIKWDPYLRRIVDRALAWRAKVEGRAKVKSTLLLLNRKGKPLSETAFRSAWRRGCERAGVHGEFTFHDIRALRAVTLDEKSAIEVLAHEDGGRTTRQVYRSRAPHVIDMNRRTG